MLEFNVGEDRQVTHCSKCTRHSYSSALHVRGRLGTDTAKSGVFKVMLHYNGYSARRSVCSREL